MLKGIALSLVLLPGIFVNPCHAQSEAAALFLTLPPGSGPNAMGTAHTAATDDFYALYFNPAGIARLQKGAAGFYHHKWLNKFSSHLHWWRVQHAIW